MRKILSLILITVCILTAFADDKLLLNGRVRDAVTKRELTQAYAVMYDSAGAPRDTCRANKSFRWNGHDADTIATFFLGVPKVDSTYLIEVFCPGYNSQIINYSTGKVGKREEWRDIGTILMQRAPEQLRELTVETTKIKFYNKGDTVVYNADAFQLAEGSMLDVLIAQLPGVELNNDGQIKVNGEFVESLLLNGKEFLDGNNNLMLENIAAYTVKNVQVYEGQTPDAKRRDDITAPKVLTMDVRLKREYNIGWLVNAQGGYGSEDRYLGRAFVNWFNPTTRVTLVANVNNLNDTRKPGKNDTWTPEQMPSGTKRTTMAGLDYNYEDVDETRWARGEVSFNQVMNDNERTTARTNFLPGGDTYENSFSNGHNRQTRVRTSHSLGKKWGKQWMTGALISGSYRYSKNRNADLEGSFTKEYETMTPEILDALYSDGSEEMLASVLNRSRTRIDGWSRSLNGMANIYGAYRIPRTEDHLRFGVSASYTSEKGEQWHDYDINFGDNPNAAERRRQYTDNSPNHTMQLSTELGYTSSIKNVYYGLNYDYDFIDKTQDSYMYALDRLQEMGIYGVLPEGYQSVFDPANSYMSHTYTNRHTFSPYLQFGNTFAEKSALSITLMPQIALVHRKLDYTRNRQNYRLSKTNAEIDTSSIWDGRIEYSFGRIDPKRYRYRNSIRYSFRVSTNLPEMTDLLDITDDSNPLNIYVGNPDLKTEYAYRHLLRWQYSPASHTLTNVFYASYAHTTDALTRGYVYDTTTGIRTNCMYNVNGNKTAAVTNEIEWQFGSTKQFTLSSETDVNFSHYNDMIGVNAEMPELTRVRHLSTSEKFRIGWQFAGQSLQLRCDYTNRHTTSSQQGFNTLNANHVNYGVSGVFKLPKGFGISTDFMCYTRRGYGNPDLDTTDPVWNARLSYCPVGYSRWVFMLDGFDLLHKLSNVSYAVSASGRTVTYTNALPRYVMFSVQYHLNIQPKKR